MNISVTNLWTESDKDGLVEYPNKAESVMIQVLRLLEWRSLSATPQDTTKDCAALA